MPDERSAVGRRHRREPAETPTKRGRRITVAFEGIPEDAIGLPTLIFEDKIEYEEIEELVKGALPNG